MAKDIKHVVPPVVSDLSEDFETRIKKFIEWEKDNKEYVLDLALLDKISPEAVEARIEHLSGQEWMVYIVESMFAEVRHRHNEFMQKTLTEAAVKENINE